MKVRYPIHFLCLLAVLWPASFCAAQSEPPPLLDDEDLVEGLLVDENFLSEQQPSEPIFWKKEPPPEFGPGSFTGTGMRVLDWKIGGVKIALHFGLHPAAKQGLERLKEAQNDFNYPIMSARLETIDNEPNDELSAPFGLVNQALGLNRFVYVIVTF